MIRPASFMFGAFALLCGALPQSAAAATPQQETLPCVLKSYLDVLEPIEVPQLPTTPTRVDWNKDHILMSLVTKGDEIEGPQRVVLLYINRLRYSVAPSVDVTIIQNPTVPAGFVATELVKSATTPAGGGAGSPITALGFEKTFELIRRCVESYTAEVATVDNDQRNRSTNIRAAVSDYESILKDSPSILAKADAESLRTRVGVSAGAAGSLRKALEAPFPSDHARMVKDSIDAFAVFLAGLEDTAEFKEWNKVEGNAKRYLTQKAALTQAKASLDPWLPGKPADVDAAASQKKIAFWLVRFVEFSRFRIGVEVKDQPGVTDEDLALATPTNCRTILGKGKSSAVSYTVTDLFGTGNQTAANAVKAVCQPVITISAGLGFSLLGDQTPAIVDKEKGETNPPTVEQQFDYLNKSDVKPLFMAQTNFRLARGRNGWSPVASIGVGVTNRTDTTVAEFLFGGGVSIHGVVLLTGGLHLGKQARIGGGFEEGDVKPPSISAVTPDNGYRTSFVFSVTFPVIR